MLQKHLREMGQRAKEKEFQQGHLNATLISMEQAALAAMRRDGHKISAVPQCKFWTFSIDYSATLAVHHEAPSVTVQHPPSKEYEQVQKIIDRQKEKLESKKKRSSDGKPKTGLSSSYSLTFWFLFRRSNVYAKGWGAKGIWEIQKEDGEQIQMGRAQNGFFRCRSNGSSCRGSKHFQQRPAEICRAAS